MAIDKETEMQRLILLGAISQMEDTEKEEIFIIKGKLKEICDSASQKQFAHLAAGLLVFEMNKEE
ncbi:hypothetical protein F3J34_15315 [Klebsiella sp. Ap-873]|nr:hypothetical protein [Klebsiella sp. Ap-873]